MRFAVVGLLAGLLSIGVAHVEHTQQVVEETEDVDVVVGKT